MFKLFLIISIFSVSVFSSFLPKNVMILKDSGVSLRQTMDPKSDLLGAVYHLYSYPVTDGKKSYVKVKTSDDFIGWAIVALAIKLCSYLCLSEMLEILLFRCARANV